MLLQGDCLELMKTLPDGSVDMVLADIPYGTTACKWDTVIPFEPMWTELKRVTKENAAICLFGSEPFSSKLRDSNIKQFKYDWVWHKNTVTGAATAKIRPMKAHEIISVFYRGQSLYNPQRQPRIWANGKKVKRYAPVRKGAHTDHAPWLGKPGCIEYDPETINPRTVLNFPTDPNAKGKLHPTQKPVALLEYLIKTYTNDGETVLDFTAGSFSTGVAAINTGRVFIGIEKDENYFAIGKKRMEEAYANLQR